MTAVSCASTMQCMAIGYPGAQSTSTAPLLSVWAGPSSPTPWTNLRLPPGAAFLNVLACPALNDCIVGGTSSISRTAATWQWNGGTSWHLINQPSNITGGSEVSGLSCPSPQFCMAVVENDNVSGWQAFTEKLTDGKWRPVTLPTVVADQDSTNGFGCASPTFCVMSVFATPMSTFGWWNGKTWTLQQTGSWYSVSCPGPGAPACYAIANNGGALSWNGTSWVATTAPPYQGALYCRSSSDCTIVGSSQPTTYYGSPTAEHWNGSWSAESIPMPNGWQGTYLAAVACPASNECIAVGEGATANDPMPSADPNATFSELYW